MKISSLKNEGWRVISNVRTILAFEFEDGNEDDDVGDGDS